MGLDYALVHLKYTIPPSILLTLLYRPLLTRLDVYKTWFLVIIAVVSTIPWDSYLIRNRIWSYPPNAVLGPTLFSIPIEELFFFVVETYLVCFLYHIVSKPTLHPIYLQTSSATPGGGAVSRKTGQIFGLLGTLFLCGGIVKAVQLLREGGFGTYMGLIVIWAFPFLLLLWTLSYQFILSLPWTNTVLPIALPTVYLWLVDTFALKRGTWIIEAGTKYGIHLWDGLEIEEAVFFFLTATLIVFGLVAFDNAMAILNTFPHLCPGASGRPSPIQAIKALLVPTSVYDGERITGLAQALQRLRKKSRSFYLASSTFEGPLRINLILLYSFCRVADDLIDDSTTIVESREWIGKLRTYLQLAFLPSPTKSDQKKVNDFVKSSFPNSVQLALMQLPTSLLTLPPLEGLLHGFDMDLKFSSEAAEKKWPIATEKELNEYGNCVAGTVAELCLDLVVNLYNLSGADSVVLKSAGRTMGLALQIVNIARDIKVDSAMGRVYIPGSWLQEIGLTPEDILKTPHGTKVLELRTRLLDKAFALYDIAKQGLAHLPDEVRGPMRVAVESYMEIGRILRQKNYQVKAGRATVPKLQRVKVAWRALNT